MFTCWCFPQFCEVYLRKNLANTPANDKKDLDTYIDEIFNITEFHTISILVTFIDYMTFSQVKKILYKNHTDSSFICRVKEKRNYCLAAE